MNEIIRERFARHVKTLRLAYGWPQEKLAHLSGLDRSYIGIIERSEKCATLDTVEKIAKALGVTASELLRKE